MNMESSMILAIKWHASISRHWVIITNLCQMGSMLMVMKGRMLLLIARKCFFQYGRNSWIGCQHGTRISPSTCWWVEGRELLPNSMMNQYSMLMINRKRGGTTRMLVQNLMWRVKVHPRWSRISFQQTLAGSVHLIENNQPNNLLNLEKTGMDISQMKTSSSKQMRPSASSRNITQF